MELVCAKILSTVAPKHKDDSSSSSSSEFFVQLIPIGIQPNKVAYMVPFDFVDDGPGGAAEGLWERLGALEVHKKMLGLVDKVILKRLCYVLRKYCFGGAHPQPPVTTI